jgi:hypothetical protein
MQVIGYDMGRGAAKKPMKPPASGLRISTSSNCTIGSRTTS